MLGKVRLQVGGLAYFPLFGVGGEVVHGPLGDGGLAAQDGDGRSVFIEDLDSLVAPICDVDVAR